MTRGDDKVVCTVNKRVLEFANNEIKLFFVGGMMEKNIQLGIRETISSEVMVAGVGKVSSSRTRSPTCSPRRAGSRRPT